MSKPIVRWFSYSHIYIFPLWYLLVYIFYFTNTMLYIYIQGSIYIHHSLMVPWPGLLGMRPNRPTSPKIPTRESSINIPPSIEERTLITTCIYPSVLTHTTFFRSLYLIFFLLVISPLLYWTKEGTYIYRFWRLSYFSLGPELSCDRARGLFVLSGVAVKRVMLPTLCTYIITLS